MAKVLDACVSTNTPAQLQSTAPRRIACDRCHGQKLKCPRDSEGASPCKRCAKAKAVCQTSPARATGRPAKNPKQRPRKLESSISSSSRPSLTNSTGSSSTSSTSSLDEDLSAQGVNLGPVMSHGSTSPEAFFHTPAMSSIPMADENSKYYPTPDMQFDFVNVVDDNFSNPFNFQYDNGTGYMCYDPPMPSVMPLDYSQPPQMPLGFTCSDTEFGVMPPPPTPPLSVAEDLHEMRPTPDVSDVGRRCSSTSNSTHGYHSRNPSIDGLQRASVSQSSFPFPLALNHKISEESLSMMSLPIRTMSEDDSASKKRPFSSLVSSCTPQNEMAWSSNLSHSQALSSIQFEVDSFSQNIVSQTMGSNRNTSSDVIIDVGELLPIAEKFMALLPQMCQQSSNSNPSRRKNSISGFQPPALKRSQTEPDPTTMEHAAAESRCIDSSLMPLIFACHTRLLLAFQIAIGVISHNLSSDLSLNHPSSSIGSYKLTSSLSTRYAIMHSLEGLEATLRKYLSPDATAFFDGVFCTPSPKRSEAGVHLRSEQAFKEAAERKDILMTKIKDIFAELGNEF